GKDWQTTINLLNLEDQQIEPTLAAYQRDGLFLGSIPALTRLEAHATQTVEAHLGLPPGSAALKLESRGNCVGTASFKTLDGRKAEVIPAIREASQQLSFPLLLAGDYRFKQITLLNTDSASANLLVSRGNTEGSG